ncbi:MAG: hypothetical protein ACXVPU_09925 [Bacteroidia bacterium]
MAFFSKIITNKNKSWIIAIVIIINAIAFFNFYYNSYYKKAHFDTSGKPKVDSSQISKIEIREGSWNWGDKTWEFSRDTKLILTNRNDIDSFCNTLSSLSAKYIKNSRPDNWLYIYFTEKGETKLSITLNYNYQKETFIEFNDEVYDGTALAKAIRELANKYGK